MRTLPHWVVALVSCFIWLLTIILYFRQFNGQFSPNPEHWGQFGDYLGGTVNPLISIIGVLAILLSLHENQRVLRAELRATMEGHFVGLELQIADNPELLRFFSITENDLANAGLNVKEFSYLVASFTAESISIRALEDDEKDAFEEGYYHRVMQSKDTQRAWLLIRKMMSQTNCRERIDNTYKEITGIDLNKKKDNLAEGVEPSSARESLVDRDVESKFLNCNCVIAGVIRTHYE